MFFVAWVLWLIYNGRVTAELLIIGAAVSLALSVFAKKSMRFEGEDARPFTVRQIGMLAAYLGTLLREIIKANAVVIRIITARTVAVEPQIVTFRTELQDPRLRVILANSITLTPGTITVSLEGDTLCVHCQE